MSKKMEEQINLDDSFNMPLVEEPKTTPKANNEERATSTTTREEKELVNCLRKEIVTVRYLPKASGIWGNNPKHVLSGGMAENATRTFVVPKLSSGMYVNVLTDGEKAYLEEILDLEPNALSIYKKKDNFWSDSNPDGINRVRLSKHDNYLDLSIPEDYIKYKILLANKDYIAPSLKAWEDAPKMTYQFVIVSEGAETEIAKNNMSITMRCYKEFGKIEDDVDTLRVVIELIEGRPTSADTKKEFLQTKANECIQNNSKLFLQIVTDPLLATKVLIKKSIEAGLISNRGGFLYLRSDNSPLCEHNEEPTLNSAAKFLNSPKHQELKFTLEAKLKS